LFEKLKLPQPFLLAHSAVRNLSQGNFRAAMELSIELKDFQTAHRVFMNYLVPAYFSDFENLRLK